MPRPASTATWSRWALSTRPRSPALPFRTQPRSRASCSRPKPSSLKSRKKRLQLLVAAEPPAQAAWAACTKVYQLAQNLNPKGVPVQTGTPFLFHTAHFVSEVRGQPESALSQYLEAVFGPVQTRTPSAFPRQVDGRRFL